MSIERRAKRFGKRIETGHKRVEGFRNQWESFEERFRKVREPLLKDVCKKPLVSFNIYSSKQYLPQEINRNSIQLKMEFLPTIVTKLKTSKDKKAIPVKILEEDGILVFSQGVQGEVGVIVYPRNSELLNFNYEYLIYKIYKYPCQLTERKIKKVLKFYLMLVYSTSYVGKMKFWNIVWIKYVKHRHKLNFFNVSRVLLKGIRSSASTLMKIKTGATPTAQ